MRSTEIPLDSLVLDARAQEALVRSQNANCAWRLVPDGQGTDALWDERVAAALNLADEMHRLATLIQMAGVMDH
jgi:hypothetical protein